MNQGGNRCATAFEERKADALVQQIIASATPFLEMERLARKANAPGVDAFERYAAMVLRDAGVLELSDMPTKHAMSIEPPGNGHLARISSLNSPNPAHAETLVSIECAVNRLVCMRDALADGAAEGERARPAREVGLNLIGTHYAKSPAGHRATHVKLPATGPSGHADIAYFAELDWRCLDNVASNAHPVFQNALTPNFHQSIGGITAREGGDWDVRTRFAAIMENLELALPFSYRFDCDICGRCIYMLFEAPPACGFPQPVAPATAGSARTVYCLRLACLAAAACFGAGRHVERAFVTIEGIGDQIEAGWLQDAGQSDETSLSLAFDRDEFVKTALAAIDSGALADPALRFDVSGTLDAMGFPLARRSTQNRPTRRIEPWNDDRELTPALRSIFHSKRVCDIDTRHYLGGNAGEIDEARADSDGSEMAAILRLENVVEDLQSNMAAPACDPQARPLYCSNALSRAAISLLDDHASIGEQAEAFLSGHDGQDAFWLPSSADEQARSRSRGLSSGQLEVEGELGEQHGPEDVGAPSYYRAPSALFHARIGLSDLYQRLGDFHGAEDQANRCIALAPTTASAYFRKADVLADQQRYAQAANVLVEGLRYAVTERDCSLLYYHLALLLWHLGKRNEATAAYVYTASLDGDYHEKAMKIVAGLRKRHEGSIVAFASARAAARELSAAGIPHAPNDVVLAYTIRATMELADMQAPAAAAPYALAIAQRYRSDPVVVSACRSIAYGLDGS